MTSPRDNADGSRRAIACVRCGRVGASMVFVRPPWCVYLNACARSAPLANPLTRSGVSRTIIRPQTLAVCRPPFRCVRAFHLRVPGAALPGGRNVLRP
jgi:ribosomal protein S14